MKLFKVSLLVLLFTFCGQVTAEVKNFPHPNPNAPYSLATQVGNIVYLSGHVPLNAQGELAATMTEQSIQVLENIKQTLQSIGLSMNDVFKCTVMIDDIALWPDFNKVYVTYFSKSNLPARSAFGVDGLPFGAMVEMECMAHQRRM